MLNFQRVAFVILHYDIAFQKQKKNSTKRIPIRQTYSCLLKKNKKKKQFYTKAHVMALWVEILEFSSFHVTRHTHTHTTHTHNVLGGTRWVK